MTTPPTGPEEEPKTSDTTEEETFLFMGKRIPLSSPSGQTKGRQAASSGEAKAPAAHKHEPLDSAKSTFDFEPLARSSQSSSSSRTFVLGGGLLLVAVMVLFLWHRYGSTEARMFGAAGEGRLVAPLGTSAFDHYGHLKAGGVSPVTRERLRSEVLPKLSAAGEALLKKISEGSDLAEAEQEQLTRIYEWAADIDSQNVSLLARRAYAAAYRAEFRRADSEAFTSLREAFQTDSQWALPFRDVARLYARAGNYANAEYFYQQTFQLAPKWALPAFELGKLAVENKRLGEAELAFRRATEADPTWPAPWSQLGMLYEIQKKKADAVAAYERALQLAQLRADSSLQNDDIKTRLEKLK